MKVIKLFSLLLIIINLYACQIDPVYEASEYDRQEVRTIFLEDRQFKESKPGDFISWKCRDYSYGGKTLLEVGRIPSEYLRQIKDYKETNDFINSVGFILYDGTNTGEAVLYQRRGIDHRWDWGPKGSCIFWPILITHSGLS